MVRRKRKPEPPEVAADDTEFFADLRELLDDTEHMDAVFVCYKNGDAEASGYNGSALSNVSNSKSAKNASSNTTTPHATSLSMDEDDVTTNNKVDAGGHAQRSQNDDMVEIRAHKCILTARGEYFKALFRKNCFREVEGGKIHVDRCFSPDTIRKMLEFIYCNRISNIHECTVSV